MFVAIMFFKQSHHRHILAVILPSLIGWVIFYWSNPISRSFSPAAGKKGTVRPGPTGSTNENELSLCVMAYRIQLELYFW